MRIGRNDPCPCGSGKKYKKCCLSKDVPDIYQCIKDTVAENGYPSKLSDTICAMLRYMKKIIFSVLAMLLHLQCMLLCLSRDSKRSFVLVR